MVMKIVLGLFIFRILLYMVGYGFYLRLMKIVDRGDFVLHVPMKVFNEITTRQISPGLLMFTITTIHLMKEYMILRGYVNNEISIEEERGFCIGKYQEIIESAEDEEEDESGQ